MYTFDRAAREVIINPEPCDGPFEPPCEEIIPGACLYTYAEDDNTCYQGFDDLADWCDNTEVGDECLSAGPLQCTSFSGGGFGWSVELFYTVHTELDGCVVNSCVFEMEFETGTCACPPGDYSGTGSCSAESMVIA